MGHRRIRFEKRRGVATLTFTHPPVNVIDLALIREGQETLRTVEADRSIRALVVTGEGRAFSAGVDVEEHLPDKVSQTIRSFHDLVMGLYHCPVPTVALVNGPAIGGGFEVVLGCDLAIAAEGASFGVPEITLGCFAPVAAVALRRQVGDKRAHEILLTGRTLTSVDALTMGLVNDVAPSRKLDARLGGLMKSITRLSRDAVEICKRAIRDPDGLALPAGLRRAEELYLKETADHPDAIEGLRAFLEKRPPAWKR